MVSSEPMVELSLLRQSLERCLDVMGLGVPLYDNELDPVAKEAGDVEMLNIGDLFCAWVQDGRYWVDRVRKMEDASIGYSAWEPASWTPTRHPDKPFAPAKSYDDDMEACRAVLQALTQLLLDNATETIFCEWRDEHDVVVAGSTVMVANVSGKGGPKEIPARLAQTLRLPKGRSFGMRESVMVTVDGGTEVVELPFVCLVGPG